MGTSRRELRQSLGDKTGDVLVLTATGASSVEDEVNRTFEDVVHLGDRGNNAPSLMGRIGYFPGSPDEVPPAPNGGHECRIVGYVNEFRRLAFTPPAPAPVVAGQQIELWAIADRVGSIGAIHRFLNEGIRAVADLVGNETYGEAVRFRSSAPTIPIPPEWGEIGGVEWTDRGGGISDIRLEDALVRPGRRTVELRGRGGRYANNNMVSLWGYLRAQPLNRDSDETDVDAEWLVEQTISAMALAQSWRSSDRAAEERRANFWKGSSAELRRKIGHPRRGWQIPLP